MPTSSLVKPTSYVSCVRCIMDTQADPAIVFNEDGLCHHCVRYDALAGSRLFKGDEAKKALEAITARIKQAGRNKPYDCIVGVSGGVDSTYVAYLVKQLGLRPLAVHFDNGWDSELAVKNIENTLRKLDIDLHTHVVDWEEFRDLQVAFLKASTPDGEIPTDHAINALLWKEAARRNIRYVISGMNFSTESISVPGWSYGHSDWTYIRDVHRRFGKVPLKTYPHFSLWKLLWINLVLRVRTISILNYVDYSKEGAMQLLSRELDWVPYSGKHFESVYTRFFQGHILPRKFGIDKRYGHLSDLINAGQMTKEEALAEVKLPPYPEKDQQSDLVYVTKKLRLQHEEFDAILTSPIRSFRDFRNQYDFVQFLRKSVNYLRKMGLYPR